MASVYWISTSSTDWNTAANWSGAAVPIDGDDVFITNSSVDIAAFDASATQLTSLTIDKSFSGKIGSASAYLQVDATTLTVGRQSTDTSYTGSSRIRLKGTYTTVNVVDTASSGADTGYPPLMLAGSITSLNVRSGKVGVCVATPTETGTCTTVNVNRADNATTDPSVTLGAGVSTTTVNVDGGTVFSLSNNAVTTATVASGTYRVEGNAAHTTLVVQGGTCIYNGTGTITTAKVYNATADFSNDSRSKTVTNCDLYRGAKLKLDTGVQGSVTFTNGVDLNGCDVADVTLVVGNDRRLTLGAAA